jgi:hypothetical protein
MPPRERVTFIHVFKGEKIQILDNDNTIARMAAPDDGIHFTTAEGSHFFVPARALWTELDLLMDGPKKK